MSINSFSKELHKLIKFYVYLLVDPRDNSVFYVGKGIGDRVFAHVAEAKAGKDDCNPAKYSRIREIIEAGYEVKHYILRWGMTEDEAFSVECAMIDFLSNTDFRGKNVLTNAVSGHGAELQGLRTPEQIVETLARGPLDIENLPDRVMSITVNRRRYEGDLYEAVRGNWNLSMTRASKADYVLAEYGGIIVGIFKPDEKGWYEVTPDSDKLDVNRRWCRFDGSEITQDNDSEVYARYIYKELPKKPRGSANPIRYFFK